MLKIYKSSAGSGKTYTLVKEFLTLSLCSPHRFRHILAITFTNKAANEMKERIIGTLDKIQNNKESVNQLLEDLSRETGRNKEDLVKNSTTLLRQILHQYADLSVCTIDSFTHRIIRSFTHDLHLPMNFEVEMDANKLLNDTIEILMDRLSEEDPQVTQAVVEFAESNIEDGKSWNLEHQLIRLGKELFKEDALLFIERLEKTDFDKLKKTKECLWQYTAAFESQLFEEGKKAFNLIVQSGLTSDSFYYKAKGIFEFFKKYAEDEFPNDALGNRYVRQTIYDDKWTSGKVAPATLQQIEAIKPELIHHYQKIIGIFEKKGKDYYLARLLLQNFYSFILLSDIQKLMSEYKKENNLLHISEFQKKINQVVKQQSAPVIYERIGDWYDHIMIDEHQDTSILQWQNLLPLIENSQFKSKDSLVVGDGKQAIYRFRNGKVEQFVMLPRIYGSETDIILKERETAIVNYGVEEKNLVYNYRSRFEIIQFNNQLYETLSKVDELKNKDIYSKASQQEGRKAKGGYVSIEFLPDSKDGEFTLEEYRNKRVEEIIAQVKGKGYALKDVTVLTRSNHHASSIASYLIAAGIPVVSSESLLIHYSPKIKLLLAALGYFDQPDNHISRAEFIYYLHLLLLNKNCRFETIEFGMAESLFEELVSKFISKEFHRHDFMSYPLVDLIHRLIMFFGINQEDPFLQFFLDEAMLFATRNRTNIREFLEWWNEVKNNKSIIYPDTLDAVRIMTLHKSKGLQFPVVILADACWTEKISGHFWVDIQKTWIQDFNIGILPINKEVLQTEYDYLYEEEKAHSFLDLLNLLYVGTTRPEDYLYILSAELENEPEDNRTATSLLIHFLKQQGLWDAFQTYTFGNSETIKEGGEKPVSNLYSKGRPPISREPQIHIRKNVQLLWSDEVTEKINRGNLIHEILKRVKYSTELSKVINKMYHEGLINENEKTELGKEINSLIRLHSLNRYFEPPYKIINERRLISGGKIKIPDRVVVHGRQAVVIEYKTGEEKNEHALQLKDYGSELSKFGFDEVKMILVYTEQQKVVEI